jgi:pyruvate ferredoxin oxidoreductase delta subunit
MSAKSEKKKKEQIPLAGMTDKSTEDNKTGNWRSVMPKVTDKCTGCGTCVMFCPDNCIELVERKDVKNKKIARVNYMFCKGCLICMNECPFRAIEKVAEK